MAFSGLSHVVLVITAAVLFYVAPPPLGERAHWNLAFTALMCGADPMLY